MAKFNTRDFIAKQVNVIREAEKKGDALALSGLVKGYGEMAYGVAKGLIDLKDDAKRFAFDLHKARKADGNVEREEPSASDVSLLRGVLRIGKRPWHSEWFGNVEKLNAKSAVSDTILKRIAGETLKSWSDETHAPSVEWLMAARTKWLKKSKGGDGVTVKEPSVIPTLRRTVKDLKSLARLKVTMNRPHLGNGVHDNVMAALRSAEVALAKAEKIEADMQKGAQQERERAKAEKAERAAAKKGKGK